MDAHAYLTSQGWRGSGHSLHATSDTIGLSRPLLVSQKQNVLGVGKKQHKTSDMWWMNAFDKSLKGLDTSEEGVVVQTVTSGALDMVAKGGGKWAGKQGLYSCFVKGETLVGSVEEFRLLKEGNKMVINPDELMGEKSSKKERKAKKTMETKEERRWRKLEKRAKRAEKEKKKAEGTATPSSDESVETKAQRKERRRLKREKKAKKAAKALLVPNKSKKGAETSEEKQDRKRLERLEKPKEDRKEKKSKKSKKE